MSDNLKLEKAEISHLTEITRIEKESFSAPWSDASIASSIENELAHCVCLMQDEKVAGYAMFAFVFEEGELLNIAVDPALRGLGYGDRLLSHVTECALENKVENLFLEVRESNASARSLYKKHGFEELGVRKNYYRSPTEDAVIMVLKLN